MDRVFGGAVGLNNFNATTPLDQEDDFSAKVRRMIDDSISYEEEYLARDRDENTKYYYGVYPQLNGGVPNTIYDSSNEKPEDEVVNKSSIVSTDVRDTVMSIMPSLMRVFFGAESVVDFCPNYAAQSELSTQQTQYVNHVFKEDNDGFLILHSVFKDALTVNYGVTKVWTDITPEITEQQFANVTREQLQAVIYENPDVEVVEIMTDEMDPELITSVTLRYEISKPLIKCEAVPPEEFRISRFAKSAKNSPLVGHERQVTRSYLVERGYPEEDLDNFISTQITNYSDERYMRNNGLNTDNFIDDGITFGEWYIRIDGDGDGIDELRYITTLGDNHQIMEDYIVPYSKFALFGVDPTPHTAIGQSITTIVKDIQKIKTNMIRGILDNLAEANNPRTVVNELLTNIEDALNDEVGAVIRTRGDVNAAVGFSKVPFIGKDSMEVVNYLDQLRASRTGITEASKGLDPDAMQSTALAGINAVLEGAQERIELIARILAETGFKDLFTLILREVTSNPNQDRTIQVNGKWVDMPLSLFDPTLRCKVNPTMGKGSDTVRMQALQTLAAFQKEVVTQFGIKNPVVTPNHLLNTVSDMMAMVNIRDTSRYYEYMTPEQMKAATEGPDEPSPELLLAQAELEKVKKDLVIANGKLTQNETNLLIKKDQQILDENFRRDKLDADTSINAAKVVVDSMGALAAVPPATDLTNLDPGTEG